LETINYGVISVGISTTKMNFHGFKISLNWSLEGGRQKQIGGIILLKEGIIDDWPDVSLTSATGMLES
jgi:hypothetical protein